MISSSHTVFWRSEPGVKVSWTALSQIRPHNDRLTKAKKHTHYECNEVKPCPGVTEGRGSELRPPVESITRLFLYKGNVEKRNLANVAGSSQKWFLPTWMRKVQKVPSSHSQVRSSQAKASDLLNLSVLQNRGWHFMNFSRKDPLNSVGGPWLRQMEYINELSGFGSSVIMRVKVIPKFKQGNCAW